MSQEEQPSPLNAYGLESYAEALALQAGVDEADRGRLIEHLRGYLVKAVESGLARGLSPDAAIDETLFAFGPVDDARWKRRLRFAWWCHKSSFLATFVLGLIIFGLLCMIVWLREGFPQGQAAYYLLPLAFTVCYLAMLPGTKVFVRDGFVCIRSSGLRTRVIPIAELLQLRLSPFITPAIELRDGKRVTRTGLKEFGSASVPVIVQFLRPEILNDRLRSHLDSLALPVQQELLWVKGLVAVAWLLALACITVDIAPLWQGYGVGFSLMAAAVIATVTGGLQGYCTADPVRHAIACLFSALVFISLASLALGLLAWHPGLSYHQIALALTFASAWGLVLLAWRGTRKQVISLSGFVMLALAAALVLFSYTAIPLRYSIKTGSHPFFSKMTWLDTSRFAFYEQGRLHTGSAEGGVRTFTLPEGVKEAIHFTPDGPFLFISSVPTVATETLMSLNMPLKVTSSRLDLYRRLIEEKGGKFEDIVQLIAFDINTETTSVLCNLPQAFSSASALTCLDSPDGRFLIQPQAGKSLVFDTVSCATHLIPFLLIRQLSAWADSADIRAFRSNVWLTAGDDTSSASSTLELLRINVATGESLHINRIAKAGYEIEELLPGLRYCVVSRAIHSIADKDEITRYIEASLLNLDNGDLTEIPPVSLGGEISFPYAWEPRLSHLAYVRYHPDSGARSLCVVTAGGEVLLDTPLHAKDVIHRMVFSPDGGRLCIQRTRNAFFGDYGLVAMRTEILDVATGGLRTLRTSQLPFGMVMPDIPGGAQFPSWSPDGSLVAIDTMRFDFDRRDVMTFIEFLETGEE